MTAANILTWATTTGLAVTCLIIFVLLIRRPFARLFGAGAAYSLWSLPVLRWFLPEFNIAVPFLAPKASSVNELSVQMTTTEYSNVFMTALPHVTTPTFQIPWIHIMLTAWLAGAVLWLGYYALEHVKIKRQFTRESQTLPSALEPVAYQAKRQMGMKRVVNIRMSHHKSGPLVIGFIKPLIVLPKGFMSDYSRRQQYYALAHELAHIKRGDLWVATASLIFRALNWPNPLIHFAAGKFRADQEAACDAYVMARLGGTADIREGYADTLVHAAKHTFNLAPTPLGLTIHHPLKERLMTMKTSNRKPGLTTRILASTCLLAALAVAAPFNLATAGEEKMAGEAHAETKGKQVIKWVEQTDEGERSEKHFEIITEDGVKTFYKISKDGTRTEVEESELGDLPAMPEPPEPPHFSMNGFNDDVNIFIMEDESDGDKKTIKKRVKIITSDQHGPIIHGDHGEGQRKMIIKKMREGQNDENTHVFAFSSDDNVTIDLKGDAFAYGQSGSHSKIMVGVAADMLENVNENDISDKAKRKLDKARKALKEAQEALEDEK